MTDLGSIHERRGETGMSGRPGTDVVVAPVKKIQSRFSMYIVNPVRIKGLLLLRIKEGCRARLYGSSTNDADKVSIQFMLPLDLGIVLHYELSYTALPGQHHLIGFANIKIDLAGERGFIQSTKKEFLRPILSGAVRRSPLTHAQRVSTRLCEMLRWMRTEDQLQSYLSPLKWSDQLSTPNTPFLKRLNSLSVIQRHRHFRYDEFDCVCQGRMPYERDDGFLSEFRRGDDGQQDLIEAVEAWATQTIQAGVRYVKSVPVPGLLANYCVVELRTCPLASRLVTLSVESFGDIDPTSRLALLDSLRHSLDSLKDLTVLKKQMGPFLVPSDLDQNRSDKQRFLESQHKHSSWDLVKDPELLPLLVRRRIEIGGFVLLQSSDRHVLLAKLRSRRKPDELVGKDVEDPGVLFQYQLAVKDDRVVVDLHMESEGGEFASLWRVHGQQGTAMFDEMVRSLKRKDQDCAQALQSRTRLRMVFENDAADSELSLSVKRLLEYATHSTLPLRFFRVGGGSANDALRLLTHDTLVANSFGARVAKLPASSVFQSDQSDSVDWFVIEFDSETLSIVSLSSVDRIEVLDEGPRVFRDLNFFTFTTGDVRTFAEFTLMFILAGDLTPFTALQQKSRCCSQCGRRKRRWSRVRVPLCF